MDTVNCPRLFQQILVKPEEALPVSGHMVIAVRQDFQQLGFLDGNHIWRDAFRPAEQLLDVIGWYEV